MKNICTIGFIALCISGCVTSRSPDCCGYNRQLTEGKVKKSISYSFIRTASKNKEFDPKSAVLPLQGAWVGPQTTEDAEYQFKTIFEDSVSSILSFSESKASECDIKLTINQQNGFNPLAVIPAFFSGASFCIIPCWADDVYYLNVKAENKRGLKKEYLIMRDVSTTTWLPLILAMPFSEMPLTARNKITAENWKDLKCKMEADGFFDKN